MSEDPFEMLASLRGTDADEYLAPGDDPAADALLARIMDGRTTERARRRPRRRRRVAAGVVAGAVVGSGALVAALWLDRPSDPATLSCYSDASTEPDVQVGLTIDPDSTPIEQCGELWRDGTLGSSDPPPLAACVTASGITAVLPGDVGTCADLGLAGRDPEVSPDQDVAARVVSAISDRYPADCVDSVDAAVEIVEAILVDVGAHGWSVRPAGDVSADRPCAFAGVDAEQQVVLIVPASGPSS